MSRNPRYRKTIKLLRKREKYHNDRNTNKMIRIAGDMSCSVTAVAQWIEHQIIVWKVMDLTPVKDTDFFFKFSHLRQTE